MKEPRISNDAAAIVKAIDRMSENVGKWLAAIAEAVTSQSDPEELKKLAARLKASTDVLDAAVKSQTQQP